MKALLTLLATTSAALVIAIPAQASTQVAVQGTFVEVLEAPQQAGCPEFGPAFNCGTGVLVPFGHVTEEIGFGDRCDGACDLRMISAAGGLLFLEEHATDFTCPGACTTPPTGRGHPLRVTVDDTVVDGTGIFAGATGTLTGIVRVAGPAAEVQLNGTLTLGG